MRNSADLGGCYPPQPSASVDNTLLDLQNSSYPTQPHSIVAKYSPILMVTYCAFLCDPLPTFPKPINPNSLLKTRGLIFSRCFCSLVSIGLTVQLEILSLRSQLPAFTNQYMFVWPCKHGRSQDFSKGGSH